MAATCGGFHSGDFLHLEHRMHAFQGTFHMSPDYALWRGWSGHARDLEDIRSMAAEPRAHPRSEP